MQVRVRLSYRVNFEGDPQRWFNVENYVKFLTEHLRSLLRGSIKQRTVQDFYPQAVALVRDAVLDRVLNAASVRAIRSDVERPAVRASEVIDGVVTAVAAVDMLDFEF